MQELRRQSTGFTRCGSQYRGVVQNIEGNWESHITINNNAHLLGVFEDEVGTGRLCVCVCVFVYACCARA